MAVHVKRVQDVRRWLDEAFVGEPSGKLKKYRVRSRFFFPSSGVSSYIVFFTQRILALTGSAGTAKTATIRVLAREMDYEILEWRSAMGESAPSRFVGTGFTPLPTAVLYYFTQWNLLRRYPPARGISLSPDRRQRHSVLQIRSFPGTGVDVSEYIRRRVVAGAREQGVPVILAIAVFLFRFHCSSHSTKATAYPAGRPCTRTRRRGFTRRCRRS